MGTTSTGPSVAELIGKLQEPQLRMRVQAVTRFGLDRGDAVSEHLAQPSAAVLEQLVVTGCARHAHRLENAATRGQDLEVGVAALAHLDLGVPRAGEQQVRVRVDQAGRDRPALRVQPRNRALADAHLGHLRLDVAEPADGHDPPLVRGQRGSRPLIVGAISGQQRYVCLA